LSSFITIKSVITRLGAAMMLPLLFIQTPSAFSDPAQTSLQTTSETAINLYRADYSARFSGLEIEAVQRLEEIEPGVYRESLVAKNFLGKIDEQSTFKLTKNQQLRPTEYHYTRSIFGSTRTEVQRFDWQNNTVHYQKDESTKETELQAGQLDMITHRLQLRRDLNAGEKTFSYPVISRGKLKQYHYRVAGEEVLHTALGPLRTVKVERTNASDDRSFTAWLASDWDHLIVKLEQQKNGDSHQLELRGAVINNQTVRPINSDHKTRDGSTL